MERFRRVKNEARNDSLSSDVDPGFLFSGDFWDGTLH